MKIYRRAILICLNCLIIFCIQAESVERNGIIFEENFDQIGTKIFDRLKISGNANAVVAKEEFLGPSPALKIWLNPINDSVSYRSEVVPYTTLSKDFARKKHAKLEKEYWYGIRIYLPKDLIIDKDREIIMQWHDQPDWEFKEDWRSPPVELNISNIAASSRVKNYILFVRSDAREITPPKGSKNRFEQETRFDIGSIEEDLGKWTQWVLHVKWSYKDDGFLKLWKNGNVVLNLPNHPNTYNDKYGPYFKFGIYKWTWKKSKGAQQDFTRIIYYDDVYIGNEQAAYRDVVASR